MPVVGASSKSSLVKKGGQEAFCEGCPGVAFISRLHRALANEAEFWLWSERDYAGRRLGEGAERVAVKGR